MSQTRTVFKGVVFSLAGAVLVVLGVGQVLAKEWKVETTRTLPVPPQQVAALVRDLASWSKWSAVEMNVGPQTSRVVEGQPGAVGQRIVWSGPRGKAVLTAVAVTDDSLDYTVGVVDADAGPLARGRVEWAAKGPGSTIRWVDQGVYPNVLLRWFGWFGALQEKVREMQGASLEALAQELERPGARK